MGMPGEPSPSALADVESAMASGVVEETCAPSAAGSRRGGGGALSKISDVSKKARKTVKAGAIGVGNIMSSDE